MNDIELVTKALTDFDKVAVGLAQLEKNFKGVLYEVDTAKGMEHAKAARQVLRQPRYDIERIRKEAKSPLLAIGKKLDDEAKRITAAIVALEDPIDLQIKSEEQRVDNERKAKMEAEQKRIDNIRASIERIRSAPVKASGLPSHKVTEIIATVISSYIIDESYAEFRSEAQSALDTTIAALNGIQAERLNHESEQARIINERAELERLRAEQAERGRVERDRREKEEQQARAVREAEDRAAREKLAAEQAELSKQRKEQQDRINAENAKLAAQRAEFERQQAEAKRLADEAEAARIAAEQAEAKRKEIAAAQARKAKFPGEDAIIKVLSDHFGVSADVARAWLNQLRQAA